MPNFVHFRTHSQYSILDAAPSTEDLVAKAKNEGMEAIALTDHGNYYLDLQRHQCLR